MSMIQSRCHEGSPVDKRLDLTHTMVLQPIIRYQT